MQRGKQELKTYKQAMVHELRDNAHKGHWLEYDGTSGEARDDLDLLGDLLYHAAKLAVAVAKQDPEAILEYAADVGNCAMFVADKHNALKEEFFHDGPIEYDPDHPELAIQSMGSLRKDSYQFMEKILCASSSQAAEASALPSTTP